MPKHQLTVGIGLECDSYTRYVYLPFMVFCAKIGLPVDPEKVKQRILDGMAVSTVGPDGLITRRKLTSR